MPFVDIHAQYLSIKAEIDIAIASVINQSAYIGGTGNSFVTEFENSFAEYIGTKYCIGCANGTDSLEILLESYGIGAGDEVIVPAFTWISTSEAVSNVGAKPIFVDIQPDYYTIDAGKIEEKITARTKAIIPVHLYGLPAEMDEILQISKKRNLIVIEDCAQAHGAEYKGKRIGTMGHGASFSFYPGKNLGAYGDAGCMITNDNKIAERCRMTANHGQMKKHQHVMEGRNSRLDGLQAAVLSVKLKHLNKWNDMRRRNALEYRTLLEDKMKLQQVPDYSKHVYHIFSIRHENRDKVLNSLRSNNIQAAVHYPSALPFLEAYSHFRFSKNDFSVAHELASSVISLPMFPELTLEQIRYTAEVLKQPS